MLQNNKPFVSNSVRNWCFAAGVAVVFGAILVAQAELNRIGFDQLYAASRIDR